VSCRVGEGRGGRRVIRVRPVGLDDSRWELGIGGVLVPMPNRNRLKKIKDMSWAIGPYCVLLDSGGRRLFNNKGLGGSSRGAQAPHPNPPR
jgi:hypothetical protein